jgi:hypothetical protein
MSMSTHVVGFKPADEKYAKMFAALEACRSAGVTPPPEVTEFFGGDPEEADPHGVTVSLEGGKSAGITRWKGNAAEGFEIDLRILDPSIKILRFYNSW